MKRIALAGLLILPASFALSGCGKPASETDGRAPARVRFQTDWYAQAEHGGHYQALAKGFYREAGLDVQIVPGGPGVTVPQKMIAGQADIGMGRSDDVIVNVSNGLPVIIVAAFMQHDPQAILVHADSPVQRFEDLNGRTIMAVPAANWIAYLQAQYSIGFEIVPMTYSLARFFTDRDFIQQCFLTNEPYFAQKNGFATRTLLIANSGYNPYRVLVTTRKFAREHPEAVRAFVAASIRGWDDFVTNDPAPGKALIAQDNPQMDSAFMDYSIEAMRRHNLIGGDPARGEHSGLITRKRMQEQVDLLVRLKIIAEPLPLERFVSFEFLPPELKALVE